MTYSVGQRAAWAILLHLAGAWAMVGARVVSLERSLPRGLHKLADFDMSRGEIVQWMPALHTDLACGAETGGWFE